MVPCFSLPPYDIELRSCLCRLAGHGLAQRMLRSSGAVCELGPADPDCKWGGESGLSSSSPCSGHSSALLRSVSMTNPRDPVKMSEESRPRTVIFGQIVIGPPGSGKTTYCLGMQEFLSKLGRKVAVVNLDPANDLIPYQCCVDIGELVKLDDVMDGLGLGPNGGLIYCMEYLEENLDWLLDKLEQFKDCYFLFDCPGQVELYTHNCSVRNILAQLTKWNFRLTAVHLVDSHYCTDPAKFISILCTSLSTMLQVELPHVNILSKMDLIEQFGKLAFNLDYYTEVLDLSYLLDHLAKDPFFKSFRRLNKKLVEVIEDYSLVSFIPLNVQDKETMKHVMRAVDKANGYCFGDSEQRTLEAMMSAAVGADFQFTMSMDAQEKYVKSTEENVEEELMQLSHARTDFNTT